MIRRLSSPSLARSFFLFGARGTGKSTLIAELFKNNGNVHWVDLLDEERLREYLVHPKLFHDEIIALKQKPSFVVVDEIQRMPGLLNYVHMLIERQGIKFALTGSSARKLKRGGANLLAGRAFLNNLYPLTHFELKKSFDLEFVLNWGALPEIFQLGTDKDRASYLRSYANSYLRQEIREEQLVRKIEPFIRFLDCAAQMNGEPLNYSKIANDSGSSDKSVESYYEILCDTHMGFLLDSFDQSVRKQQRKAKKFYFFDLGVKRSLEGALDIKIAKSSYVLGKAFEHFLILEVFRLNEYFQSGFRLSYLRSKDNVEIDLILEKRGSKPIAIEIKSSSNCKAEEFKSQERMALELGAKELWVFSQNQREHVSGSTRILPWSKGVARLFKTLG